LTTQSWPAARSSASARCSRRSGVGVWVPSALSRRKLGEERWGLQGVFDGLQEALGDGQVEELYTMRLGVGVK
jgi:hypothetical protein